MTIAVGFCFQNGVLICADTEMTDSAAKYASPKIFPYAFGGGQGRKPTQVVFAITGSLSRATRAVELCARALSTMQRKCPLEMNNEGIQNCLEETLRAFHEKHIFPHPHYGSDDAPWVGLIIGLWSTVTGRTSLLTTDEEIVKTVHDYHCLGIGSYFARYACAGLFKQNMSLRDIHLLAIHVLQQTKNNVPNCGKQSQFIALTDGKISPPSYLDVSLGETYSDDFIQLMNGLLFKLADPDEPLKNIVDTFSAYAEAIREERKAKTDEYERVWKILAGTEEKSS